MSLMGLVSRVTPVHTAMRNCTRDEGRSFEVGNQVLISSHRKLLSSKAMVVNVAEKSEQDFDRGKSTMAKKRARKRQVWNKGLEIGKRDGFTPDEVKRIRGLLADRGIPGLRDLALFSTAIDTMLHGQDLLPLVVGDVQRRDGSMRPVIEVARARGMPPVRCALSNASTKALEKWITASGKKRTDYLFPGRGVKGRHSMGQRQLNRLLKLWVVEAGLDPSDYSVELLRRTKALHILKGTGDLQTVRALLGHARIESTARYLGLKTKADPIVVCRAFDI